MNRLHEALCEVLTDDWRAAAAAVLAGARTFRVIACICPRSGRVACGVPYARDYLAGPAIALADIVLTRHRFGHKLKQPSWRGTWRQFLLLNFAYAYGMACLGGEPPAKLDELLDGLARLAIKGERRASDAG